MKRLFIPSLLALTALLSSCSVQSRNSGNDIVVLPLGGEVKITEGSMVYALPLTVFEFEITATRTLGVPGPYANYAAEMIGLDNIIEQEHEYWTLTAVRLNSFEELDPAHFYIIEGTSLMQTNLLLLKESGLVLDINPAIYSRTGFSQIRDRDEETGTLFPDRGAYEYVATRTDTAYRVVKADTAFIRVPYLVQKKRGMTVEEEAREAADRLLELREGRHMILTGETNIFPQDGAAIDEINRLDREYTALFAGKSFTESRKFHVWLTPDLSMAGVKTTVFNFSAAQGVLPAESREGIPVQIEIVPSGKTRELKLVVRPVVSQKELTARDRLYYRVPDVAGIKVTAGEETLCTARKLVYQFGNTVTLPSNFIIGK
jgi:hypothetical protein